MGFSQIRSLGDRLSVAAGKCRFRREAGEERFGFPADIAKIVGLEVRVGVDEITQLAGMSNQQLQPVRFTLDVTAQRDNQPI